MANCYVCLESTEETSPCYCHAALHRECFERMQSEMPHALCTLCKEPFEDYPPKPKARVWAVFECIFIGVVTFVIYLIGGYVGKMMFSIVGFKDRAFKKFWTLQHAYCAFVVIMLGTFLFCLQKCKR